MRSWKRFRVSLNCCFSFLHSLIICFAISDSGSSLSSCTVLHRPPPFLRLTECVSMNWLCCSGEGIVRRERAFWGEGDRL